MRVAAVILAGGASRRMGSPKPLLRLNDETFADRLIRVLGEVCRPIVVVLGHGATEILPGIERRAEVLIAVNPQPDLGQLSSLQCGLRTLTQEYDAVMFTPVDYPAIEASTVGALAAAIETNVIAVPRFNGRRGHPVCLRAQLAAEILALPREGRASDVIHAYREQTAYVEVNDPGIASDVDDRESYQRLLAMAEKR
ncbi:MAG: nucleotidyltransferase family protein [Bryobacteraceae bacterium]